VIKYSLNISFFNLKALIIPLLITILFADCSVFARDNIEKINSLAGKKIVVSSASTPFESNGDLWFSTWADDNTVFVTWGDGFGVNLYNKPPYSHNGLAKLNGHAPRFEAKTVKSFMPLSDNKNNSKTTSLLFYNKRLYAAIHSPLLSPNMGFIAYSDDYGKTFNYDINSPWTKANKSNFICRIFINMGKDYSLNADEYVYAFGIGSEIKWHGPIYLSRVKKDSILDYSAWEYFVGIDSKGQPHWDGHQTKAVPIPGIYSEMLFSAVYHSGLRRFIILTANFHSGEVYISKAPWGPWKNEGKWFEGISSEWFGSYMPGIIPKNMEGNSFYFAVAGREPNKNGHPSDKKYRFRLGKITIEK
jgi:hypothetical protein